MTITPFVIYLISLADNMKEFTIGIAIASAIIVIAFGIKYVIDITDYDCYERDGQEQNGKQSIKYIKIFLIGFIITLFISYLIPSAKTLMAMYVIPPIVNNSSVQKLPVNLLNFVNDYLEKSGEEKE